jgi:hypothetical protein
MGISGTDFLLQGSGFKVQGSGFRGYKMLNFSNTCQLGSNFWMKPDEADPFLVNRHPNFCPETKMEPLAQTWIRWECF